MARLLQRQFLNQTQDEIRKAVEHNIRLVTHGCYEPLPVPDPVGGPTSMLPLTIQDAPLTVAVMKLPAAPFTQMRPPESPDASHAP